MDEYKEEIIWHEISMRPLTEEEAKEYEEWFYGSVPSCIMDCELPDEDGQEILVATKYGVDTDTYMMDSDDYYNSSYLDSGREWTEVFAWAEMPKYRGEGRG